MKTLDRTFEASFVLGRLYVSRQAWDALPYVEIIDCIRRHSAGDWGLVCDDDWQANDQALKEGARLLSTYETDGGIPFWIITEADRSATTVLLPEEY